MKTLIVVKLQKRKFDYMSNESMHGYGFSHELFDVLFGIVLIFEMINPTLANYT